MTSIGSVLLVDDDKITNYINERLIKKSGLAENVIIKNNGEEALTFFKEGDGMGIYPSLILLDINMPVVNGIEFIEAFQKMQNPLLKNIKICILSTSENQLDIDKIKSLGHFYFVSKPLTKDKIESIYIDNFN
jgi:CheY-like chemotaxis protein